MAGPQKPEQEPRRIFASHGEVEIIFPDGTIFHITRNPQGTVLRERTSTQEAQQAEWKSKFAGIFYPHVGATLTQHGYRVLGGEVAGGEMTLMETTAALQDWMREGRTLGIARENIIEFAKDALGTVNIAERKMGQSNAIIKGIEQSVVTMSEDVWEVRRRRVRR